MVRNPYTKQEDAALLAAAERHGLNWTLISQNMRDRSPESCKTRFCRIAPAELKATLSVYRAPKLTPEQERDVLRLRKLGRDGRMDAAAIASRLGLRQESVRRVLQAANEIGVRANVAAPMNIPIRVWEERDRAYSISRDLTSVLLGDPLPGRSALDQSRARYQHQATQ